MPWFKVDDGFPAHPKLERLASEYPPAVFAAAVCVWTLMGADCMARLTDGRFSFDRVIKVVPISPRMIRRALDALTSIGLLDDTGTFHDWPDWQRTKAQILRDRDSVKRRVSQHRNAVGNAVTPSDVTPSVTVLRSDPIRSDPGITYPSLDADAPSGNAGTKPKRQRQTRELPPLPFTLAEIEAAFRETLEPERCQFGPFDPRLAKPLTATVRAFAAAGYGLADVRLVGEWVRGTWSPGIGVAWQSIATVGKLTGWAAKARSWRDTGARPRTVGDRPDEFGSFEYDVVGGGPS